MAHRRRTGVLGKTRLMCLSSNTMTKLGPGEYATYLDNIDDTAQEHVKGISIDSVSFPNVFPNLTDGTFSFVERDPMGAIVVQTDYTIDVSSYLSLTQAQEAIVTELGGPTNVAFSEEKDGRVIFESLVAPGTPGNTVELVPGGGPGNIFYQMGFVLSQFFPAAAPYTITATYPFNYIGRTMVYLKSEVFASDLFAILSSSDTKSFVCAIPIDVEVGLQQNYVPIGDQQPTHKYHRPLSISKIDISLRDEQDRPLDIGVGALSVNLRLWF